MSLRAHRFNTDQAIGGGARAFTPFKRRDVSHERECDIFRGRVLYVFFCWLVQVCLKFARDTLSLPIHFARRSDTNSRTHAHTHKLASREFIIQDFRI